MNDDERFAKEFNKLYAEKMAPPEIAELRARIEKLEEFALSMADFIRVVDEAPAWEQGDQREAWRAAHAAARARRRRELGR